MIRIDLNDTFDATSVSEDLKRFVFNAELKDNSSIELKYLCCMKQIIQNKINNLKGGVSNLNVF